MNITNKSSRDYIIDEYDDKKYIDATFQNYNFIIVKGGDGSLLKAIHKFKYKDKPFFGIAGGTENFLMNNSLPNNPIIKKFNLIKVKIKYLNLERDLASIDDHYVEREKTFYAFNDIMIGGDMNSWIDFNVEDKDNIIGHFKGGGLIISTPQGSTGINKNNGGVILPLSSHNWSITGDKTNRKINYVLDPHKTTIKCSSRTPITVWVDGSNKVIKNVISVTVSKGDKIKLAFNDISEFKAKRKI